MIENYLNQKNKLLLLKFLTLTVLLLIFALCLNLAIHFVDWFANGKVDARYLASLNAKFYLASCFGVTGLYVPDQIIMYVLKNTRIIYAKLALLLIMLPLFSYFTGLVDAIELNKEA